MAPSLDDLRAEHPALGFALYALEPRGVVTFEVYDGDNVFTFKGATTIEAIDQAFPPEPPTPELPAVNVFD